MNMSIGKSRRDENYLRLSTAYNQHLVDEMESTPKIWAGSEVDPRHPSGRLSLQSFLNLQPVADAWLRQDMPRPLGVRFQLLAQLADEDSQRLHIRAVRAAPYLLQEMAVRQHLAGVDHELLENVVLLGRQPHLAAAHADAPMHEIDGEVGRLKQRPAALLLQAMRSAARMRAISSSTPKGLVT